MGVVTVILVEVAVLSAPSAALNVIEYLPACPLAGFQLKLPVTTLFAPTEVVKVAPTGNTEVVLSNGAVPSGSVAITWNESCDPSVTLLSGTSFITGGCAVATGAMNAVL